jgi:hypothetical protein
MRTGTARAIVLLSALAVQTAGCQFSTRSGGASPSNYAGPTQHVSAPVPAPMPGAQQQAMATGAPAESYHARSPRSSSSALLSLPGSAGMKMVNFAVVDNMAVMEGDIMLGAPAQLPFRYGLPRASSSNTKSAVALINRDHFWPNGEIPFVIDSSALRSTSIIQQAAQHINSQTALKVRPRTAADQDFLVFRAQGDGDCSSFIGRIGGPQEVLIGGCPMGSVVHEVMHAAGFFHEQSRGDRDQHIFIDFNEVDPSARSNFEIRGSDGQDIGPYDYGSIMHYSSRAFSRTGRPTIIPRDPNARIGQREGLSSLDLAAVAELYGPPGGGAVSPTPVPTPTPNVPAPTPTAPNTPVAATGFGGSYTSQRGNVSCTENQFTVQCQYPGGSMFCGAQQNQLDCAWTGGGQGRALFQRQGNGVLAGTFGDFFSNNSRGQWDLVPAGAAPAQPPPASTPAAPPPSSSGSVSFAGNYTSTRGPMACADNGRAVTCSFQEQGSQGRADCVPDQTGLRLSCTWLTFPPRIGSGRATFTRRTTSDRNLTGTFGIFAADAGAGTWNATPQ